MSATASSARTSGCSISAPGCCGARPMEVADGTPRLRLVDPNGLVHATLDRCDPLRGRAARRGGADRRPVRACRRRDVAGDRADPRAAAALASPLTSDLFCCEGMHAVLVHTTKASGLTVGVAMDHRIDGPPDMRDHDLERLRPRAACRSPRRRRPARRFGYEVLGYSWSGKRTVPAVRDQVSRRAGQVPCTPAGTASSPSSVRTSTLLGDG